MPEGQLNILLVMADQMRGDCLGVRLGDRLGGGGLPATPNLDRLAADGVRFTNHFAQTSPCGPSRTSLLTGLYLMNHRSVQNGTPLDARHSNIALEARKAGYDPLLFGYTDTSVDPRLLHPGDPALGTFEGVLPGMRPICQMAQYGRPWKAFLKARGYAVPDGELGVFAPQPPDDGPPRPLYPAEHSDSAYLADRVLEHHGTEGGAPWFYHVTFLRPHPPLIAPDPYRRMVDPADTRAPRRFRDPEEEARQHPYFAHLLRQQRMPGYFTGHFVDMQTIGEARERGHRATYLGLITEVDHHVGRIVDRLKETGEYDRTLIVFTCDHGEMLGDHWLWGKEGTFDAAFHIPLVIRDPRPQADGARGTTVPAFTESVDIMPTVLDLAGARIPETCDGESLRPFLEGRAPAEWRTEAHWEFDFRDPAHGVPERELGLGSETCNYAALRGERYKYVHFAALPPLLFDLQEDPNETRNLAEDGGYRDVRLECAHRLLDWRMRHAERALVNILLTEDGPITHAGPRI